jgi:hypothetical protein
MPVFNHRTVFHKLLGLARQDANVVHRGKEYGSVTCLGSFLFVYLTVRTVKKTDIRALAENNTLFCLTKSIYFLVK